MKELFDFKTLAEFLEHFKDEDTCRRHFASIRFKDGAYCPHCGHSKVYGFGNGKRYRCASCKKDFTVVTNTVFGETKLPLKKWFIAIYLLSTTSKGISSVQLAKHVGVTQKTAWFMDHRIRSAMSKTGGQLFGTIECDETFIGGLEKNKHANKRKHIGTGGTGKTPIFGMKSRRGAVIAKVVTGVSKQNLQPIIQQNVVSGERVYTDNWVGYKSLAGFNHTVVNHSSGQDVQGDAHTNGIESFWALFKRGYHGVYHWMSKKHMQRYVSEFAYRWNARPASLRGVFSDVVEKASETGRLPYKKLIA